MRDALDCRSPARCASCEHFSQGECALEAQLEMLLAPKRAPRIPVHAATRPLPVAA